MFDTKKFGGYFSRLRKNADMTQIELADRLNLTRQAISRYEHGDSFPDISILVLISDIFGVSLLSQLLTLVENIIMRKASDITQRDYICLKVIFESKVKNQRCCHIKTAPFSIILNYAILAF